MPTFREYNTKLKSLRNMRRVMLAMKMVSATKFMRAQEAQRRAQRFYTAMREAAIRIARSADLPERPLLLRERPDRKNLLFLVFTSDRGLCAGFNNSLLRLVERHVAHLQAETKIVRFSFCGKRGYLYLRKKVEVRSYYEGLASKPNYAAVAEIGHDILTAYLEKKYDEVHLAYNQYINPLTQRPIIQRLLPLEYHRPPDEKPVTGSYIFEPAGPKILDVLLEKLAYGRIFMAVLENAVGEHGARMTAMENAVNNIDKLNDYYLLHRNRARQAAITNELVEIVAGAEALK